MKSKTVGASFKYAWAGIKYAFKNERNLKIHLFTAGLVLVLSAIFQVTRVESYILILTMALVIFAEMVNTAIETTVDLVCQEFHPLAEIAKNVAAGAVLVTSIAAMAIGLLIFYKYFFQLIF